MLSWPCCRADVPIQNVQLSAKLFVVLLGEQTAQTHFDLALGSHNVKETRGAPEDVNGIAL